jgi:hypothetical protein
MQGAKAKKPRNNGVTVFQIVGKPDQAYWSDGLAPFLLPQSNPFNLSVFVVAVREQLEQVGCDIVAMYAILHDKDEHSDGELKDEHMHILVKVKAKVQIGKIAECLGIEPQFIEKGKQGPFSFSNSLAYLIHAKDPDKHQYDPSEVVTVVGTPYTEVCVANQKSWQHGRNVKAYKGYKEMVPDLMELIMSGSITHDQIIRDDTWRRVYAIERSKFDGYLLTHSEYMAGLYLDAFHRNELGRAAVYITGLPGCGKSFFSKALAKELCRQAHNDGADWSSITLCDGNPFDKYAAQQIVIVDDLRSGSMGVNSWLMLLDPIGLSDVKARYANKQLINLVTLHNCHKEMEDFFRDYVHNGEPYSQFVRRYSFIVTLRKLNGIRELMIYEVKEGNFDGYFEKVAITSSWIKVDDAVTSKVCELIKARIKAWGVDAKGQLITFKLAQ